MFFPVQNILWYSGCNTSFSSVSNLVNAHISRKKITKLNVAIDHATNTNVVCYSNHTSTETFLIKFHLHLAGSSQEGKVQELQADLLRQVSLWQKYTMSSYKCFYGLHERQLGQY